MAEGSYEYECMRAELLGLKTPDKEEFEINQAAKLEALEEEMDTINLEDAEMHNEQYSKIGGKLNDLNSILKSTQRKINNFKTYGFVTTTVTSLLKLRKSSNSDNKDSLGGLGNNASSSNIEKSGDKDNFEEIDIKNGQSETPQKSASTPSNTSVKKSDLSKALDKQTDVLDRLLEQSDKAHLSMSHQEKQMKKFLKR